MSESDNNNNDVETEAAETPEVDAQEDQAPEAQPDTAETVSEIDSETETEAEADGEAELPEAVSEVASDAETSPDEISEEETNGEESSEEEAREEVHIPNLPQIIEGAVLAADKPLSIDHIIQLFPDAEPTRAQVREAIAEIQASCEGRGFDFKEVASGYRFQVRGEYADWIGRLWEEKPPRYTRALLETLALIAYKQPITRGDIEEIRGVAVSTNIIRTLLEREWIRVVGHRDVPGRPSIFATTKTFLDYFDLRSLDELPTLSEIKDLDKVNEELNLETELIEPRTLNLEAASDEIEGTDADDESLNEVTDRVNAIQENIKNLFKEPEPEEDWDDEEAETEAELDAEQSVTEEGSEEADAVTESTDVLEAILEDNVENETENEVEEASTDSNSETDTETESPDDLPEGDEESTDDSNRI